MAEISDTFSMDCPNCGPSTVHYLDGEMVPHGCDYVPRSSSPVENPMSDTESHKDSAPREVCPVCNVSCRWDRVVKAWVHVTSGRYLCG